MTQLGSIRAPLVRARAEPKFLTHLINKSRSISTKLGSARLQSYSHITPRDFSLKKKYSFKCRKHPSTETFTKVVHYSQIFLLMPKFPSPPSRHCQQLGSSGDPPTLWSSLHFEAQRFDSSFWSKPWILFVVTYYVLHVYITSKHQYINMSAFLLFISVSVFRDCVLVIVYTLSSSCATMLVSQ